MDWIEAKETKAKIKEIVKFIDLSSFIRDCSKDKKKDHEYH